MTSELVLTRGLPASGKTTFSTAWVDEAPASRLRVNRDDLRACLYGKPFLDYLGEQAVTTVQHAAITAALGAGKSVVVDDTNLRAKYARALIDLAVAAGASWRVEDFTDIPLAVCIDRDAARGAAGGRMVGEDVIRGMHARYLASGRLPDLAPTATASTTTTAYVPDEKLPPAWIVDVDGTLARMGDRGPFDWHRVSEDTPNPAVVALARALSPAVDIVVMSGRDGIARPPPPHGSPNTASPATPS